MDLFAEPDFAELTSAGRFFVAALVQTAGWEPKAAITAARDIEDEAVDAELVRLRQEVELGIKTAPTTRAIHSLRWVLGILIGAQRNPD